MPYSMAPAEQTHVPFMIWMSDNMKKHKGLDMDCLKRKADTGSFSHDNLSHTLLNLMDIATTLYDPKKDVLASCENEYE
jgi:lipid A ethanolaminephosphotransferase